TLIKRAMAARGIEQDAFQSLHDEVLDIYNAADGSLTTPYPGVEDVLKTLSEQGVRLGVCTNKPEGAARHVLRVLGWDMFEVVVGGDRLPVRKPAPQPLNAVWEALGNGAMLYVGDSEIDAETAVAAGVKFALFTEGYRKNPVERVPHDFLFSDYADFLKIVENHLSGA
ncbi:MAG: HAD-IA family hydrolase, partial [Shimia sp.]|nr:HAD-IA family hydrolase [Shimia sp.]